MDPNSLTIVSDEPIAAKDAIRRDSRIRSYTKDVEGVSWVSTDDTLY
jgi:hypothetical protein